MGVMNKFMNFLGLQEEEEVVEREVLAAQDEPTEATPFDQRKNQKNGNIVSIHSQKNVKVVLVEPRSYDEAQEIADHLRSFRTVVVNLQRVRNDQALRIIDFLSGTVYALVVEFRRWAAIFFCVHRIPSKFKARSQRFWQTSMIITG